MNILIFSWRGLKHPNAGGAEIVTHEHARAWVAAKHSVTIFTSSFSNALQNEVIDGVLYFRKGNQSLQVHVLAFIWYLFQKKEYYDLVIDQFHGIPFFTPLYVRGKKLAFIHELTKELWELNPWKWPFHVLPSIFGKTFEPFIIKYIYRDIPFMTVSNSTRDELIEWNIPKKNIRVIQNGIHFPKKNYMLKKEKNITMIFLGSIAKDKGIEKAIDIFGYMHEKNPSITFWIVGKGEENYMKFLHEKSIDAGLKKCAVFWGYVSEKKKYELLSRSHLLINPSFREGWGLVVIEAAAVGTPAIAFNVPGLRDSIVDNKTGLICFSQSSTNFADIVLDLLKNEKKCRIMQMEAKKWANKFTWERAKKQSQQYIAKIAIE